MKALQVVPVGPTATIVHATRNAIVLTHSSRWLIWCLLVSLQLATATLLAFLASIYFTRNTPNSLLWTTALYFIFADGYDFINRYSFTVAMGYALLSTAFALGALRLVWFSLRSRRVSFGTPTHKGAESASQASEPRKAIAAPLGGLRDWLSDFGVHGSRFDYRQLSSKAFSLASQTTAAYLTSHSISNVLLNQTYGLVIFLNGISTLVFFSLLGHNQLLMRFVCLLTDVVLDFVWGDLLPLWMHLPIIKIYRSVLVDSPMDGASSECEVRRVFVLSWPSYLISIIPFANSLLTVLELVSTLRDHVSRNASSQPLKTTTAGDRRSRWVRYSRALLVVYGCVVLGISLSAADIFGRVQRQPLYGCRSRLHPWFSTKEACVQRTIDCAAVGIDGRATNLEAALSLLDEDSLSDLSFTGCSSFEMPSTLSRFPALQTLIVENSTISRWDFNASLADDNFTNLKVVKLLEVNTTTILHGLVSVPIAKTIEYIRFHGVPQAASILASVGSSWQHLINLDCDLCNLTELPLAVDEMYQLTTLSLAENGLRVLREDFITRWDLALIGLWLDGNPGLTELSDAVWRQVATCDVFKIQNTNISVIPDWVPRVAHDEFFIYAYGAPVCDPEEPTFTTIASDVRTLLRCEESLDS